MGEFPVGAVERLHEIGAWMDINGDAIYGTRAIAPYCENGVRFTQKAGSIFAFLVDETASSLGALQPRPGAELRLLGYDGALDWTSEEGACRFQLPEGIDLLPRPLTLTFEL